MKTVLTISDAHTIHCLTEGHIDEWWRSLPTARKVALFEADLEGHLDFTPAFDPFEFDGFEKNAKRFIREMKRLHKSPFAGLAAPKKEAANAAR